MRFFVFLHILFSGDIMKNKINANYDEHTPPAEDICDTPETAFEQINKYGTYEIQPTSARADYFPAIAQGLPTQPTGRNKRKDNTKSKLHNSKELWDENKKEQD